MANPAPGYLEHPKHRVAIQHSTTEISVHLGEFELARSTNALYVEESRHQPVWYLPLSDIQSAYLKPTSTETYCPFKGYANYWSIETPTDTITDGLWGYQAPYDECLTLANYAAFYSTKVDIQVHNQSPD